MKEKRLELKKFFIIGIIVIFFMEIFICNYRFWESLSFKTVKKYSILAGESLVAVRDNVFYVEDDKNAKIYIYDMDAQVENIYLDMDFEDKHTKDNLIQLAAIDEGNSIFVLNFEREYNPVVQQSHYYRTHFYGKVSALALDLGDFVGMEIEIKDIRLNAQVPFWISSIRLCVMVVLMGIVCLLWKASIFINITYETLNNKKICFGIMVFVIALSVLPWGYIAEHNGRYTLQKEADQYMDLTDALLQGKVYVDKEVPQKLKELDNPYDYFAREKSEVDYLWDYAYFDGQYYVYFGIVPVLIFYIPYYLIFGSHLLAKKLVFLILFFALCGILALLWKLMIKYYPKTPVILFGLMNLLITFSFGSCICHDPDIYSIPILSSLAFSTWGLYLGILGFENYGRKRNMYFTFAACCLALTAGCRPQFLLVAFFLLPSFVREIKRKDVVMKDKIGMITAVAIPYIIVATGLMYYNYIRFGSVFDFGANYNLTTNDMRHRGFVLDRIWDGIFFQLLQPVSLSNVFPFVEQTVQKFSYNGIVILDYIYGGLFSFCPFIWIGLYALVKKNFFENKRITYYLWGSILLGMIILILDTEMAGLVYRYILDFGIFFIMPAIVAVMDVYNNRKIEMLTVKRMWFRGILVLITVSFVLYTLIPFATDDFLYNDFFMKVKTAVQFW